MHVCVPELFDNILPRKEMRLIIIDKFHEKYFRHFTVHCRINNMKKTAFIIVLIATFFMQPVKGLAQEDQIIVKQKKISRHFKVKPADKLIIENTFGNVTVNTWDKNEVTVDITMAGKAKKEARAQVILDNINIKENTDTPGMICFKTFEKAPYNNNNGVNGISKKYNDYEANITYVINAPENIGLDITNIFGDVYVGDFKGRLNVNVTFGSFHAKNISGPGKIISVDDSRKDILNSILGDNTISSIESGYVTCSRGGNLAIDKLVDTAKVKLKGWSNVTIGKGK